MKNTLTKSFSAFLALVMLVSLCCVSAFAADSSIALTYDVNVDNANSVYVHAGDEITVSFTLRTGSAFETFVLQNEIEYDTDFFEVANTVVASKDGTSVQFQKRTTGQQIVKVSNSGRNQYSAEETIASFKLKVKSGLADGTTTTVRNSDSKVYETSTNQITNLTLQNLTVTIGDGTVTPTTYTATFTGGAGATGTAPTAITGTTITLPANTFTRTGWTFAGWSDGTSTYQPGASYTLTTDTAFTAQWSQSTVTVTFNANGGSGTMEAQTLPSGVATALTVNAFTREGNTFADWNTAADGSGAAYTDAQSVTLTADMTLYAQWARVANYTVTYILNSGIPASAAAASLAAGAPTSGAAGSTVTVPNASHRSYDLTGWSGSDGQSYAVNSTLMLNSNIILTAQWSECHHDAAARGASTSTSTHIHVSGTQTHFLRTATTATCADCTQPVGSTVDGAPEACTAGAAWVRNATVHYHLCTADGCGGHVDEAAHTFVNGACSVCGYADPNYTAPTGGGGGGSVASGGTTANGTTVIDEEDIPLAGVVTTLVDDSTGAGVMGVLNEDDTVTIIVSDASGNTLSSVSGGVKVMLPGVEDGQVAAIIDSDGNIVDLLEKSVVEDSVAYTLVNGSCTIEILDNAKDFVDVQDGDWFNSAVVFASSHELFQGVSDKRFAPDMPMTRGMLVTVLWRLENKPDGASASFDDVASGTWYAEAVEWAAQENIVDGYGDGTFLPDRNISRQEMAAILYRYMNGLGYDMSDSGDLSMFADGADVSAWAQTNLSWAYGAGIITGKGNGRIDPLGNATRAEVATMLMRIVSEMVK